MWIVSKLEFNSTDYFYSPYAFIADGLPHAYDIYGDTTVTAVLKNTATGKQVRVSLNSEAEYLPTLQQLKPYGYFPSKNTPSTDKDRHVFMSIDDMSFKFLDLVDDIEGVRLNPSNKAYSSLQSCSGVFDSMDSSRSVYNFSKKRGLLGNSSFDYVDDYICTILHAAIRALKDGCWVNGSCYLRHNKVILKDTIDAYKVSFTNQAKALQFCRKAINSGFDMLEKYNDPTFFYGELKI